MFEGGEKVTNFSQVEKILREQNYEREDEMNIASEEEEQDGSNL